MSSSDPFELYEQLGQAMVSSNGHVATIMIFRGAMRPITIVTSTADNPVLNYVVKR